MATSTRQCKCAHPSQDKLHGANQRVHNKCGKGWRCTACGNVVLSGSADKK